MKGKLLVISLLGAGIGVSLLTSEAQPNKTRDVMRAKLQSAQGVLEGIAVEDFGLIATNAQHLQHLSQATAWLVRPTPEYQRFTLQFRRQTRSLQEAARRENVDAAILAYFQLTVSCVHCHQYLGRARVACLPSAPIPSPSPPKPLPPEAGREG